MNFKRMRFSSKIKKIKLLGLMESKDGKMWMLRNKNAQSIASVVVLLYPLDVLTSLPP